MAKYKSRDSYKRLYAVLHEIEKNNTKASIKQIADRAGYKYGSMGAYARNKLKNVYLFESSANRYKVSGIASTLFESFAYYMSQKSHLVEDRDDSLFTSLRNRSLQAFYLSLSIFNNPTLKYRVESFSILLANAWELLFKAKAGAKGRLHGYFCEAGDREGTYLREHTHIAKSPR